MRPDSGLLNISSFLAPALDVTKFIIVKDMILATLFVLPKSDLDVPQTRLRPSVVA
jgi:hypothetical protein